MSDVHEITAQTIAMVAVQPDEVWRALTNPRKLKQFFFGADVESDFQVGSPIVMRGDFRGKPYADKGKVVSAVPGKRLSFSHWSALSGAEDRPENYHLVTIDLIPESTGTKVRLTQANLTGGIRDDDRKNRAQYEKNWQSVLDGLKKVVEV